MDTLLLYLTILGWSMLKFMVGVAIAIGVQLSFWEQFLLTGVGGICGILVFTYLGDSLRQWWALKVQRKSLPNAKRKSASYPAWVETIWSRYGLLGAALLTPPILSPPIGTAVALAFGAPRSRIVVYNTLSMVAWAVAFGLAGKPIMNFIQRIPEWLGF